MKTLLTKLIKLRNPNFKFHDSVTSSMLFELVIKSGFDWLRSLKLLLRGRFPGTLFLEKGVSFFHLSNIRLGKWVKIGAHSYLSGLGNSPLSLGNNVSIGAFSRIIISTNFQEPGEFIKLEDNVGIGEYAYLGGAGGLTIGSECIIGQYFSCHPENHNYQDKDTAIRFQGTTKKGISIGRNCWIGSKVTILDGVTVGHSCVIAAGAVVTKNFPENSIIGGVPAKIIGSRLNEKQTKINKDKAIFESLESN